MNQRASELIHLLNLNAYPEGGCFREVYRSSNLVHLPGSQEERRALTTMYYLLHAGEYDSWHRLSSDEVWHYYEGAPLELIWIEPGAGECARRLIGEAGGLSKPVAVVPAGCWQMARTTGEYTLVGCTVGPGFEREDYTLLRDLPEKAGEIQHRFPEFAEFV